MRAHVVVAAQVERELIDCRSRSRNSGLMCAAKLTGWPGSGSFTGGAWSPAASCAAGAGGPTGPQSQRGTAAAVTAGPGLVGCLADQLSPPCALGLGEWLAAGGKGRDCR